MLRTALARQGPVLWGGRLAARFSVKADIKLVKELRSRTGAPIGDCKKALQAANNDISEAGDWLRKNGLAAAAKKAGRETSEGLVGVAISACGTRAAMVEVNSETDFVARNEVFQDLVQRFAETALECDAVTATTESGEAVDYVAPVAPFLLAEMGDSSTVQEELNIAIATVQENMRIARVCCVAAPAGGQLAAYMHNSVRDGLGQAGAVVALTSPGLDEVARKVAMHIVAARPPFLKKASVPAAVVAKEEEILTEEMQGTIKKAEMIPRVVQGKMGKFFKENCLQEQQWLLADTKSSVAQIVAEMGADNGVEGVEVALFARLHCGEAGETAA